MSSTPCPHDARQHLNELARLAQAGDQRAFEELVQRFQRGLQRVLMRRSGRQATLVEELLHQTWIAVWDALRSGRYDPQRAAVSTFIYAVAHKLWLQHLRRASAARLRTDLPQIMLNAASRTDNPAGLLHAAETLDALRACLSAADTAFSLSDEERQVVVGLGRGESERTLATSLGLAASTVHGRKQSAFRKLRRCMAAKGFYGEMSERGPDPDG